MRQYTEQVRSLVVQASRMPLSTAGLAMLEEAVRLADTHQDIALGIETRQPLMAVARNLLRGDVLTTAFVWCLAQHDREPRRFAGRNLFTEYRWVIGQLSNLADVARATLEEMLADMGRRLERAGFSLRHMYFTQQHIAPDLGDPNLARSATEAMRKYPRDALSSNSGWELAEEVETELFLGREEHAYRLARPFLEDRFYQHSKADQICGSLLLPLLKWGRLDEAKSLHARCSRSYHPERVYYWWFGELLKFSALTDDFGRALQRYAECQRAITECTDPLTRLHFALDALVVFDRLLAVGKQEALLRLPDRVPVPHRKGLYQVADLRAWLYQKASELADRFDARNGNGYFRAELHARAELQAGNDR